MSIIDINFPVLSRRIHNFRLFPFRRTSKPDSDTFESINPGKLKLKYIKSKTAEKLYSTNFPPSDTNNGEYTYKTFVFDKKTGEPVEMIVKPVTMSPFDEEYRIFVPNRINRLGEMTVAGNRYFSLNSFKQNILSGAMTSYLREDYEGLGLREQQLAIERMLMMKKSNIELKALPQAYFFHKKCGFEVIKNRVVLDEREFSEKIDEYARNLQLDRDTVKKMVVYKREFNYILDENSTIENFMIYAHENNIKMISGKNNGKNKALVLSPFNFTVDMRLSKGAIEEWKQLIKRSPILIGKKFPRKI